MWPLDASTFPLYETLPCETNPLSQLGLEVVEDEVGEGLRHCPHMGDIMSHHCVGEGEGGRGAIWEVAHHQTIWGGRRGRVVKREKEGVKGNRVGTGR